MIPHHSTALTTTNLLIKNREKDLKTNSQLYRLAKDIIVTQEKEILFKHSIAFEYSFIL